MVNFAAARLCANDHVAFFAPSSAGCTTNTDCVVVIELIPKAEDPFDRPTNKITNETPQPNVNECQRTCWEMPIIAELSSRGRALITAWLKVRSAELAKVR